MGRIKFGTDGWRGVISEDYTFANVRLVAAGIAEWVRRRGEQTKGIVVGYDARFLSAQYAQDCAAVLADEGIKVWLSAEMLSSPALTALMPSEPALTSMNASIATYGTPII